MELSLSLRGATLSPSGAFLSLSGANSLLLAFPSTFTARSPLPQPPSPLASPLLLSPPSSSSSPQPPQFASPTSIPILALRPQPQPVHLHCPLTTRRPSVRDFGKAVDDDPARASLLVSFPTPSQPLDTPTIRNRLSRLCQDGKPHLARLLFVTIPRPSTTLWNTITFRFVCNGLPLDALLFKACVEVSILEIGKALLCYLLRSLEYPSRVGCISLLNMFSAYLIRMGMSPSSVFGYFDGGGGRRICVSLLMLVVVVGVALILLLNFCAASLSRPCMFVGLVVSSLCCVCCCLFRRLSVLCSFRILLLVQWVWEENLALVDSRRPWLSAECILYTLSCPLDFVLRFSYRTSFRQLPPRPMVLIPIRSPFDPVLCLLALVGSVSISDQLSCLVFSIFLYRYVTFFIL